jgi:hypothetical protein
MAYRKAALSTKKRTQLSRAIPEVIPDKSVPVWHPVGSLQVQRAPTTPAARDAEPSSSTKQKLGPPPLPSFGAQAERQTLMRRSAPSPWRGTDRRRLSILSKDQFVKAGGVIGYGLVAAFASRNIPFPTPDSYRPGAREHWRDILGLHSIRRSGAAAAANSQSAAAFRSQRYGHNHASSKSLSEKIPIDGKPLAASRGFVLRRLSDAGLCTGPSITSGRHPKHFT